MDSFHSLIPQTVVGKGFIGNFRVFRDEFFKECPECFRILLTAYLAIFWWWMRNIFPRFAFLPDLRGRGRNHHRSWKDDFTARFVFFRRGGNIALGLCIFARESEVPCFQFFEFFQNPIWQRQWCDFFPPCCFAFVFSQPGTDCSKTMRF